MCVLFIRILRVVIVLYMSTTQQMQEYIKNIRYDAYKHHWWLQSFFSKTTCCTPPPLSSWTLRWSSWWGVALESASPVVPIGQSNITSLAIREVVVRFPLMLISFSNTLIEQNSMIGWWQRLPHLRHHIAQLIELLDGYFECDDAAIL